MSDEPIYPTGTCFTDALELLEHIAKTEPDTLPKYAVVHAIVVHPDTHERYSHAWLEVATPRGPEAWQGGIWCGNRITYALPVSELEARLRPQRVWRYSVEQVWEENRKSGHYGRWVSELEVLCRNHVCRTADIDETGSVEART